MNQAVVSHAQSIKGSKGKIYCTLLPAQIYMHIYANFDKKGPHPSSSPKTFSSPPLLQDQTRERSWKCSQNQTSSQHSFYWWQILSPGPQNVHACMTILECLYSLLSENRHSISYSYFIFLPPLYTIPHWVHPIVCVNKAQIVIQ